MMNLNDFTVQTYQVGYTLQEYGISWLVRESCKDIEGMEMNGKFNSSKVVLLGAQTLTD